MRPRRKPMNSMERLTVRQTEQLGRALEENPDWLPERDEAFVSPYSFLQKHAWFWTPGTRPVGIETGTPGRCYENSFCLAAERRDLTYCEGIVLGTAWHFTLIYLHGWCITKDGVVIDPTLDRPAYVYWGIAFSTLHAIPWFGEHGKLLSSEFLLTPDESVIGHIGDGDATPARLSCR